MWRRLALSHQRHHFHTCSRICAEKSNTVPNVIEIKKATFYRRSPAHPANTADEGHLNPAIFPELSFRLPFAPAKRGLHPEVWSILSPSSLARTTFLRILASDLISVPSTARSYPYLAQISVSPYHAIKYVGFDAERGTSVSGASLRGTHLSARYESRREATDFSLLAYLQGNTQLNALEREVSVGQAEVLEEVIQSLELGQLLDMPVANLSNGQTRRARIAKALMAQPEVLLLDGPFMGLDPNARARLEVELKRLAEQQSPRMILSLRPQDKLPEWVTHLIVVDEHLQVVGQGSKAEVLSSIGMADLQSLSGQYSAKGGSSSSLLPQPKLTNDGFPAMDKALPRGEPLVEMAGVCVAYGQDTVVLGGWSQPEAPGPGFHWTLHRGQRCGIFGPNGSGKTTILSLITSDHPQAYGLPIKLFGRSRLPEPGQPGISVFDLQRKIGHSSPEVHAFFPKHLSVRRVLETAWADAPLARPELSAGDDRKVDAILRWFGRDIFPSAFSVEQTRIEKLEKVLSSSTQHDDSLPDSRGDQMAIRAKVSRPTPSVEMLKHAQAIYDEGLYDDSDISWADNISLRELSFPSQRLLLFLRAIITAPDLVVLDEAFNGMDDAMRDKALLFLSHGEHISRVNTTNGQVIASPLSTLDRISVSGLDQRQALLCISHTFEDVPGCIRDYVSLPPPPCQAIDAQSSRPLSPQSKPSSTPPRFGTWPGPIALHPELWQRMWE